MHRSDLLGVLALTAGVLLLPAGVTAQEREVVSKQVSVGLDEATLELEFSDGGSLDIRLDHGDVLVDGESIGTYEPGGGLDAAWRKLLGDAVALDDGPLGRMLVAWAPPDDLNGDARTVAETLDGTLEGALTTGAAPAGAHDGPRVSISVGKKGSLLSVILKQLDQMGALEGALGSLPENVRVHIGEDVVVGADETVEGPLLVIQGDARIEGTVDGDVVVIDGTVDMRPGSRVAGDVKLANAKLVRNGESSELEGDVIDMTEDQGDVESRIRNRVRAELGHELVDTRSVDTDRFAFAAPFRSVFRGVGGVIENLITVLLLGLIGAGIVAFWGDQLDTVAETARNEPGRAAMVGMAGTFLLLPVWVLGMVALAVSIVGIPVMIAWIPLFPLAALAAGTAGYLAVARNIGEWLATREFPYTRWIRRSNPVYTMLGGLLGLMAAFVLANLFSMVPFFGFLRGLLVFAGTVITGLAVMIGFGAVLLTRAGRRTEYYPLEDLDDDLGWDDDLRTRSTDGRDEDTREGGGGGA